MKRLDYFTIGLVIIICVGFYITYFIYKPDAGDVIEIYYQDMLLNRFNIADDLVINISGTLGEKKITMEYNETKEDFYEIVLIKDFLNIIQIKNQEITMRDADCKNKNCTYMIINNNNVRPIVCTNGIIVRMSRDDVNIIA